MDVGHEWLTWTGVLQGCYDDNGRYINNNGMVTEYCWYTFRSGWLLVRSFCLLQAMAPSAIVLSIISQHTADHIKNTWACACCAVPLLDDSNSAFYIWQEKFASGCVHKVFMKEEEKYLPLFPLVTFAMKHWPWMSRIAYQNTKYCNHYCRLTHFSIYTLSIYKHEQTPINRVSATALKLT
jgi:hypothetical protein